MGVPSRSSFGRRLRQLIRPLNYSRLSPPRPHLTLLQLQKPSSLYVTQVKYSKCPSFHARVVYPPASATNRTGASMSIPCPPAKHKVVTTRRHHTMSTSHRGPSNPVALSTLDETLTGKRRQRIEQKTYILLCATPLSGKLVFLVSQQHPRLPDLARQILPPSRRFEHPFHILSHSGAAIAFSARMHHASCTLGMPQWTSRLMIDSSGLQGEN
ncbi:hypothetical protein EV702DRAFT_346747 [Suillus placidus]|uniref:Uncharacterized protein n=1 Tax=Suillus placidus TaxID=48579 RepID=A0A9P6ZV28_9AGAM|nr:hypothetical protein EV702DRAFT_346747 [Suillus placidus]